MAVFRMPPLPPKVKPVPVQIDYTSPGGVAEVGVQVKGLAALEANLRQMGSVAMDAAGYEMANIAAEVIEVAKDRYVPIDIGNLRDSGRSDEYQPNRGQTITTIRMWFGGTEDELTVNEMEAADITGRKAYFGSAKRIRYKINPANRYALEQHENMSYDHHGVGGPKYLEIPFNNIIHTIQPRIASAVAEAIGMGAAFVSFGIVDPTDVPVIEKNF